MCFYQLRLLQCDFGLRITTMLHFFKCRQFPDRFPNFAFGQAQVIDLLQVHPEFRACSKEMPETQGRVAGYGAATFQDFSHNDNQQFPRLPAPEIQQPSSRFQTNILI